MITAIARIFNDISLSWIDTSEDITNNKKLDKLLHNFPNLKELFQHGKKLDNDQYELDFEEKDFKAIKDAADSCPVNVIHIIKKDSGEKVI